MQNRPSSLTVLSLAALAALGACNNKPTTIVAGEDDPQAEQLKKAPAVAPPPMIQASRTYRCDDNSLVYADFYTNNTAQVRTKKGGPATTLTAEGGQPPYKAEGWSLSANSDKVTLSAPGKKTQGCNV